MPLISIFFTGRPTELRLAHYMATVTKELLITSSYSAIVYAVLLTNTSVQQKLTA